MYSIGTFSGQSSTESLVTDKAIKTSCERSRQILKTPTQQRWKTLRKIFADYIVKFHKKVSLEQIRGTVLQCDRSINPLVRMEQCFCKNFIGFSIIGCRMWIFFGQFLAVWYTVNYVGHPPLACANSCITIATLLLKPQNIYWSYHVLQTKVNIATTFIRVSQSTIMTIIPPKRMR